jgi:hypothetical protein
LKEGSSSFLKKRTKKLLFVWAEPVRKGRSQNGPKFFASFFQKRRLSFALKKFCMLEWAYEHSRCSGCWAGDAYEVAAAQGGAQARGSADAAPFAE